MLFSGYCNSREPLCSTPASLFAGLAGSVLEERLNRTNTPHWYCATEVDDWQTVWLSLQSASRPDCLIDELQVFYDDSTGRCVRPVLKVCILSKESRASLQRLSQIRQGGSASSVLAASKW